MTAPTSPRTVSLRESSAAVLLREAREHERAGRRDSAVASYRSTIELAEQLGDYVSLAEALRRLSVVLHRQHDIAAACALCERSLSIAHQSDDAVLAAEALNTRAGFFLEAGEIVMARATFTRALQLGAPSPGLEGRLEQNLGIVANIEGDLAGALRHYERSLDAFQRARDESGCAIAYHNLGMISADRRRWEDAEAFFHQSLSIAERLGDVRLRGLCLLNRCEVLLAQHRYEDARASAETALRVFDELGARTHKADAYKFLGVVYRETGRPMLAEARLQSSIQLAIASGAVLGEAEASRELARLYQDTGRNQDALRLLNIARRLFVRLGAQGDMGDVVRKVGELEETYLEVVRDWGQSIESADSYTFGHCERVATFGLAVARQLGLDAVERTTVRIGAYLHDLGKVRVPHEILNKPGALTREEFDVMKQHPVYGVELLGAIDFPWDIKPIIRWHHEKADGTGYPDRLSGEEIPLAAQIIGIVDVYDALTTTRSYRPARSVAETLAEMHTCRHWWRAEVYDAFLRSVGGTNGVGDAPAL